MNATTTPAADKPASAPPPWQTGEPPHDRAVILIGKTIESDGLTSWAEMIYTKARWSGEFGHWHGPDDLALRRYAESDLIIHFWADLPPGDTWPVHFAEKGIVEKESEASK